MFNIRSTYNFDMSKWREHVKALQLDAIIERKLTAYIEQRYLGLGFDDTPQYKFYLLEKVCHCQTNQDQNKITQVEDAIDLVI
ncbi:hypothetical protein [Lysinibacillus contaminans]|uniref:hypothetical protein n=1 Tax=Lysinibacillus contaminans TaxID=1293441 RepID=UPI0012E21F0A|nr:hypothetical protein [Lysinibacillus contaminans]